MLRSCAVHFTVFDCAKENTVLIVEFGYFAHRLLAGDAVSTATSVSERARGPTALVNDELHHEAAVILKCVRFSVQRAQFLAEPQIVRCQIKAKQKRMQPDFVHALPQDARRQPAEQIIHVVYCGAVQQLANVTEQFFEISTIVLVVISNFGHFSQNKLTMIVAAVVMDMLADELFRFKNFKLQQMRSLHDGPLAVAPGVIVCGTFIRTLFAQTNLERPIDCIVA